MRTMTQALLALGFVGAMAVSTPVTTKAQGIYFSGSSVGVGIGNRPDRYRYTRRYYRDYENSYAYDRRPYSQRYYNSGYNGFSRYGEVYNFPYDRRTYY